MKSKSLHTLILGILLPVLWITATNSASGQQLIPLPNQVTRHEGAFTITSQTVLVTHEFKDLANYLNDHIEQLCGFRLAVVTHAPDTNYISLRKNQHLTHEAYSLAVTPVQSSSEEGSWWRLLWSADPVSAYAFGSICKARFSNSRLTTQHYVITTACRDYCRCPSLCISRSHAWCVSHFFTKEQVMQYLDWMSRHKLNCFHWHLTDDNGWRIEIKNTHF